LYEKEKSLIFVIHKREIITQKQTVMKTYKNYTSPETGKVGCFENQFGNITVEINLDRNYSLEYFDDESEEERTEDFLSEYGKTENSSKAITLINDFIQNNF